MKTEGHGRRTFAAVAGLIAFGIPGIAQAQSRLIPQVPDFSQPPLGSIGNPVDNACAPMAAANVVEYWDVIANHPNAIGVKAGIPPEAAADHLYYFMDTNDWGSPARLNGSTYPPAKGSYTADIAPGVSEFVRWDSTHLYGTPPPPILPGKNGYDWTVVADTLSGFPFFAAEIDSGRPPVVVFSHWRLLPAGPMHPEPSSGEPVEFFDWGPPDSVSPESDPPELWKDAEGGQSIGHAVTGVGYWRNFDPDGPGPWPLADWIICHDNWASTGRNVALPWRNWKATVRVDPGSPGPQLFPGSYCQGVPDHSQPPNGSWGCATANFCAPVSVVNVIDYWDAVVRHSNAVGLMGGLAGPHAADYAGYFMATNGISATCGSPGRLNIMSPGTFTLDIAPGGLEYIRWDAAHPMAPPPPPGLPPGKAGYAWTADLDTLVGFTGYMTLIDSCKPPVVVFRYWNPLPTATSYLDAASGDTIDVYLQGPPIGSSQGHTPPDSEPAPAEEWPCALEPENCSAATVAGHAVTGVGYVRAFDPDAGGPLPLSDWIVCHDNWRSTGRNVMINWTAWSATVAFNPFLITGVASAGPVRPDAIRLSHNYPNPFNASTTLVFDVPEVPEVRLSVVDLLGREVGLLHDGAIAPGRHSVVWNAGDHGSGVYFARLSAGGLRQTLRLILIR